MRRAQDICGRTLSPTGRGVLTDVEGDLEDCATQSRNPPMRTLAPVLALLLAACASTYAPLPQRPPRNPYPASLLDFHVGFRSLDGHDWGPVEDQGVFGVEFAHEDPDWPVGFELGLFASGDKEDDRPLPGGGTGDIKGETSEFSVGFRKTFIRDEGPVHPYIGGGLSAIRGEFHAGSFEDDDTSGGIYFHGGVDFDLGPNFFIGFDMRFLGWTDITLFGEDGSADYGQIAMVLGVRF